MVVIRRMCLAMVMFATLPGSVGAARPDTFNPRIVATYSLPGAGPMVSDGAYLWVANGPNVTAIDPVNGNAIVSQNLGGQWNLVDLAYDIPGRKLWASFGHGLMMVSTQDIISSNGNGTISTSTATATAISLDVSVNRQTWYVVA